jgi:hypothetical protein
MKRLGLGIGAIVVAWATGAAAIEGLSVDGAALESVKLAPATANVSRTVALNGDAPTAAYVTAHMPDGRALQRTNLGYWQPWDGKLDSLVDNGFRAAAGSLTFKILKEDISGRFFPITVTLAYRAGDRVKYGVFQIMPE